MNKVKNRVWFRVGDKLALRPSARIGIYRGMHHVTVVLVDGAGEPWVWCHEKKEIRCLGEWKMTGSTHTKVLTSQEKNYVKTAVKHLKGYMSTYTGEVEDE